METLHGCVPFFALRDIQPGEEITVDYEERRTSRLEALLCAKSWRGRIKQSEKIVWLG